ncbi:hypothetical protein OTU49_006649 [Cherax quadricarinatus]|uniref:MICAL-like protein 1 n=2 Tax=Cherax quadricarinatus TaxID=27406 RepID=A0AAW0X2R0_CHEQU
MEPKELVIYRRKGRVQAQKSNREAWLCEQPADTTPAPADTTPAPADTTIALADTTPAPADDTTPAPADYTTPVPADDTIPAPADTTPAPVSFPITHRPKQRLSNGECVLKRKHRLKEHLLWHHLLQDESMLKDDDLLTNKHLLNDERVPDEHLLNDEHLPDDHLHALLHHLLVNTSAETADIMSSGHRGTKALELWARRATDGYQGVNVSNMTTAWRNGLAFCALIHRFRPDLIEYSSLKPENVLENNALAFRIAEQQLGIPALLDAEDMVENDVPDRLSVLTYVSQYYQAFAALGLTNTKRVVNNAVPQAVPAGTIKTRNTPPLQRKNKPEIKSDKVLAGGRVRREVCAGCSNPVFLAERLSVGSPGQLMHRTCFRCARCNTQLTLASYYETEKGQFCCETCPDEEHNNLPDVDSTSISSHTSSKHKRRSSASDTESDSDSNTEDSGDESDSYSHNVESLLEDKTHHIDTRSDTLSHSPQFSPKPLKPRTVFLSQTLEGNHENYDSNINAEDTKASNGISHFSQVSSALFGSQGSDSRVATTGSSTRDHIEEAKGRETRVAATGNSTRDHCDEAKGSIIHPPETLTLDTGQGYRTNNVSNGAANKTSSSIVAQRLKMFREISDKTVSSDKKKTKIEKSEIKSNYFNFDNRKKETSCVTREEIKNNIEDLDKDENSKDSSKLSKVVHIDEIDSDMYVNEEHKKFIESVDNNEMVNESTETLPSIPSIAITPENQEVTNDEVLSKEEDNISIQSDSDAKILEEPPVRTDTLKEYNPFEDEEEESQQDESGVAVSQSEGGSDGDNYVIACVSQDSGAEISSTSLHSIQYPEDLNPFGSDEERQPEGVSRDEAEITEKSDHQDNDNQKTTKKLIKVNMNPFESDEDQEYEKEMDKEDKKKESKSLNPFWSDDDEPENESESAKSTPSKVKPPRPPPPTLARNSAPSQMYQVSGGSTQHSPASHGSTTRKRIIAPPPPTNLRELFPPTSPSTIPAKPHPSPSLSTTKPHPSPSSPSGSIALKRKARRAPAPPQDGASKSGRTSPTSSIGDTLSSDTLSLSSIGTHTQEKHGHHDDQDEVLSWKMQKDLKNHSNKLNGSSEHQGAPPKPSRAFQPSNTQACLTGIFRCPSLSKSEAGEWQRKKGPAPPRPVPQKRALKKLPMRIIQQELQDIEIKQTELERQGVLLETSIRNRTENAPNNPVEDASVSSGPNSIEVEDMIMQLFELVNEKNELFRRQTELMYLKREKRLEEEYVELEYQIRCLMLKTPSEKTESDNTQEEELIARLVKVVEQRDEIINCLELDRLREAQEDESIATHMMQYQEKHIDGIENGSSIQDSPKKKKTLKLPKKKKKKEKKDKKGSKADADKDIDETEAREVKKKKKKKWLF